MPVDVRTRAREEAPRVARQLEEAARESRNEAEFRAKAAEIFQKFADSVGVTLRRYDEYSVASGRADAVYNRLVIEYKAPGKLTAGPSKQNDMAIEQIVGYIRDIAAKEHREISRMAGIVLDGRRAIFLRFYEKTHVVDPPVELTPEVVERLLKYLLSLQAGVALIPENLLVDFGAESPTTQKAVKALYEAISKAPKNSLSDQLFLQWQIFFQEISGYESGSSKFISKPELRAFVEKLRFSPDKIDPPKLLFAVHTYFALIIKLIAWLALSKYLTRAGTSFSHLSSLSSEHLRSELAKLERGGLFRELGIRNLLEGDFFGWYLDSWNSDIWEAVKLVMESLGNYDPGTVEINPEATRDLLKKLYHYLLPRELRHDLGEYYTPDWLAELTLNRLEGPQGFSGDLDRRVLDPACGSGTFLLMTIKAMREAARREMLNERELLQRILANVVGIDLNPLAVIASRTNYLLAILDLLEYRASEIDIPVYLADSILIPSRVSDLGSFGSYRIKTAVGTFELSAHLATRERADALANLLDDAVSSGVATSVFLERAKVEMGLSPTEFEASEASLKETFERIDELHRLGLDGLWARIVKNGFAPLFVGQFDYVVGNPPWVNWESLPSEYRSDTKRLWERYGLFPHGGMDTILGKGKKDISMLMTYVAMDKFLKPSGRLAFVITQSVFKTSGAGQGFRRFALPDGTPIKVVHVDDMVDLKPFEGATNRTAVMVLEKGRPTTHPVPYTVWRKAGLGETMPFDASLEDIQDKCRTERFATLPVDRDDPTSPWLTLPVEVVEPLKRALGKAYYEAHAGAYTGGANGVYWLEVVKRRPDGIVVVRNLRTGAKREVEHVEVAIEPDLLYPLLRGRDVDRWLSQPSAFILLPQDPVARKGIDEGLMQSRYIRTYRYLKHFEKALKERRDRGTRGIIEKGGPFYSVFGVGNYTMSPWKVLWREVSNDLNAVAVGSVSGKPVVPDHTLIMVSCGSKEEAYYLAAILNSAPARLLVRSYIVLHPDPHILQRIRIERFDGAKSDHVRLAQLGEEAHIAAENRDRTKLRQIEKEIDEMASRLWGISYPELRDIWRVLGV